MSGQCKLCERPTSLCECEIDMRAKVGTVMRKPKGGVAVDCPGVEVPTRSGPSYTFFPNGFELGTVVYTPERLAQAFANYLNSDNVFDCVIPRIFLR